MKEVTFKKYDISGVCEKEHECEGLSKTIYSNGEVTIDRCSTCGARLSETEYQLPSWIDESEGSFCHIKGDMDKLTKWCDTYLSDDEFTYNYAMSNLMEEIFDACEDFEKDEIIEVSDKGMEFGIALGKNDISYKKWCWIEKEFNKNGWNVESNDKVAFTDNTAWLIKESDIYVLKLRLYHMEE
jgi:hypothetical protein